MSFNNSFRAPVPVRHGRTSSLRLYVVISFAVLSGSTFIYYLSRLGRLPKFSVRLGNKFGSGPEEVDLYPIGNYVKGAPTPRVVDNLRNDTNYITTFNDAGFTNQVITILNLVQLASLTDRVAVIPPFIPYHMKEENDYMPFGQIFDLPRLKKGLGQGIIEWQDLKDSASEEVDELGCWSIWATAHMPGDDESIYEARGSSLHGHLKTEISFTPAPKNIRTSWGGFAKSWPVARLTYPSGRQTALNEHKPKESWEKKIIREPEERFQCFDYLYYIVSEEPFEFQQDFSPAWNLVGKQMHFHPNVNKLSRFYLRRIFQLEHYDEIPPFIGMHIRHGDFKERCGWKHLTDEECLVPISDFRQTVEDLRGHLYREKGVKAEHVLVMSDEQDPAWWKSVKDEGWYRADHELLETEEELGEWYTIILDQAMLSMSIGMIGTDGSTFSQISMKRVEDWNNGISKTVKWYKAIAE